MQHREVHNVFLAHRAPLVASPVTVNPNILWNATVWVLAGFVTGGIPGRSTVDGMDSWGFALSDHPGSLGISRLGLPAPRKQTVVHSYRPARSADFRGGTCIHCGTSLPLSADRICFAVDAGRLDVRRAQGPAH